MRILVTGGAGYIGSITVRTLAARGHDVEILDDLSTGHRAALFRDAVFHRGSLLDVEFLADVFRTPFDAIVHFAGFSLVGESVENPLKYYRNNVGGSLNLLREAAAAGVAKFVFSSTAAVYGQPRETPISEDARLAPINPYGRSKLAIEWALEDAARQAGIAAVALRYFNACGAVGDLGEDHDPETHLIPRLLGSLLAGRDDFRIFGDDYGTPDGTCIRDYIHVQDLAEAHALALEWADAPGLTPINLGTEAGTSVLEIVDAADRVTGLRAGRTVESRRSGDPDRLVASAARARDLLGWKPEYSGIDRIIADAWAWHRAHPGGYDAR